LGKRNIKGNERLCDDPVPVLEALEASERKKITSISHGLLLLDISLNK